MKISIITATYNSEATVKDTFESIFGQSYKDFELIVVDGASKDSTLEIVKSYCQMHPDNMKYISEPDKGIYDAMNKGIHLATGDIIGILNSDDFYYDENVLLDINKAFEENRTDCVFGNLVYVDANNTSKIRRIWHGSEYHKGKFSKGWIPAHPTFYAKREIYARYGGFRLDFKVSADFEMMLRLLGRYEISSTFVNRYFVRMRTGGESNGSLRNIMIGNNNIMRAFKENGLPVSRLYPVYRLTPKILQMMKLKIYSLLHIDCKP